MGTILSNAVTTARIASWARFLKLGARSSDDETSNRIGLVAAR
jgi:hypothetical protein